MSGSEAGASLGPAAAWRLQRNFEHLARSLHRPGEPATAFAGSLGVEGRRVAVVCWDLAHNPAGRAHVLADLLRPRWNVSLVGPMWPRFGASLWAPLQGSAPPVLTFRAETLQDVWAEGAALALAHRFDLVVISKPRLPGLILGLLLAEQSRCPILFDFDEDERAFLVHHPEEPAEAAEKLLHEPFGTAGTMLAAHYWPLADAVTAASRGLGHTLGAHLVRHARDEGRPVEDRAAARRRLGYRHDDFVIAFIGTARRHKGLGKVVAAMAELADPRLKLMVVGTVADAELRRALQERLPGQVQLHEPCPMHALGGFLAAADLVPLLQDRTAPVAHTQTPAKLTDALRHGIRVVATRVPPLEEPALADVVDLIDDDGLPHYLARGLAGSGRSAQTADARRVFEDEFSFAVNRARLEMAVAEAERNNNPFSRAVPDALQALADTTRRATRTTQDYPRPRPGKMGADQGFDIAFFWKQNDSGLFGRRPDMLVREFLRSGHVGRILHFDHPVNGNALRRMARAHAADERSVAATQFRNVALRGLRMSDEATLRRRTILTRDSSVAPTFAGQPLHAPWSVAEQVAAALREEGFDPANTIAWVCPVVRQFAAIAAKVPFRHVVVDLIDDERSWARSEERRAQIHTEYAETLHLADLVLTNGVGNRERFAELRPDIHVVPNGAELHPPEGRVRLPGFLETLRHPAIVYAGNLNTRIDWELVRGVVEALPAWDFVFIGPRGDENFNPIPEAVLAAPNVLLPGALPYDVTRACLAAFDCAIVPHTRDATTESMNPLKVYNYLASGLPVVTTPLANLGDVSDLLLEAADVTAFCRALRHAVEQRAAGWQPPAERLQEIAWERRAAQIIELLNGLRTA